MAAPGKTGTPQTPPPGRSAPAILALSLAVLAVALYVWWSSGRPAEKPQVNADSKGSLTQDVLSRAKTLVAGGQPAPARDLMLAYVGTHPDDVLVRPLLARTLWDMGQLDQAQQVLSDLENISPLQAQTLWLKGQIAKARGDSEYMKLLSQAVEGPTSEPEMAPMYALELIERGQDEQARKYLQRAADAGVSDPRIGQGLGQLALKLRQYPQAIAHLENALKLDRANAACWRMLAQAHREDGSLDQAAQTLNDALKACRDRTGLYFELGNVRLAQSQPAQAADAYALAADPEVLAKDQRLGAATEAAINYYQVGRYAAAMKYIDLAASLDSTDARVRQWAAKIEQARFWTPASEPAK